MKYIIYYREIIFAIFPSNLILNFDLILKVKNIF